MDKPNAESQIFYIDCQRAEKYHMQTMCTYNSDLFADFYLYVFQVFVEEETEGAIHFNTGNPKKKITLMTMYDCQLLRQNNRNK